MHRGGSGVPGRNGEGFPQGKWAGRRRLATGRLPGARIVLADCGLTRDARALAAYLADREPGVALTDGAVIRLDENEHTKEEEHGRAGHL